DPVSTRIDVTVERKFIPLSDLTFDNDGKDEEIEMDQDDSIEPLEEGVDLLTVLTESLTLELPAYPRSEGAVLKTSTFSADGTVPMSDEDAKPFAGLAALRAKLEK
ncbi:MAG: YceD family protein, partial [Paracoccaceae bacterium]